MSKFNNSYFTDAKPEKHELLKLLSSIINMKHELEGFLGVDTNPFDGLLNCPYSDSAKTSKAVKLVE